MVGSSERVTLAPLKVPFGKKRYLPSSPLQISVKVQRIGLELGMNTPFRFGFAITTVVSYGVVSISRGRGSVISKVCFLDVRDMGFHSI